MREQLDIIRVKEEKALTRGSNHQISGPHDGRQILPPPPYSLPVPP